jgi:hypothetical protein
MLCCVHPDIRQRLYDSLDEPCALTVGEEQAKLARLDGARRAVDQLAFVCQRKFVGEHFESAAAVGKKQEGQL